MQQDPEERRDWKLKLLQWEPHQLVFLDESAAHERTGDRKFAWSPIGAPAGVFRLFKRSKRWSILPAFTTEGYCAWQVHHGSITHEVFNDFVRYQVLPQCTPLAEGGPNSVIILDNARIHHSEELEEMCREAGVGLEYLPAYCPDFNPIETSFSVLKAWLKKNGHLCEYYGPESEDFERFLKDALSVQAFGADAGALFRASGISYESRLNE